ncbi:hypothetical protein H8E52_06225 [bacterium]|nr:hypothetical protein [bacterium]
MIIALYRLLAPLAAALLPLFARFSPKLAATLAWRKESPGASNVAPGASPRILVHVSSAGELEQARPLLWELCARHPEAALLVTLSSASARKAAKDLPDAHRAIPMPADTPRAMARLLDDFTPDHILVIKWDLWPSLMGEARRRKIPVFLLGAVLSAESGRSRWPGRLLARPLHGLLSGIGAASKGDAESFRRLGVAEDRLAITGDTRFDRVIQRRQENRPHLLSRSIHPKEACLVVGSSWPAEETLIWEAYPQILAEQPKARLLLAPHEPSENNLCRLEAEAARRGLSSARLSTLDHFPEACVVLADVLGQLAELYRLGSLAFVGGGFGDGVHSVLEAAAHGLPVIMGPRIERAAEAAELVEAGAGWVIRDSRELLELWRSHMNDVAAAHENAARARLFVDSGAGAAQRSLDFIEKFEI